MEPLADDVDAFLTEVVPARRAQDARAVIALLRDVTGKEPTLWRGSIVGFGACHYRYPTGTEGDCPVIGIAPRKAALTVYLLDGADAHAEALARLGPHATGKGCLYLKDVSAVEPEVLRGLLEESYRRVTSEELPGMHITITA